MNTIEATRIDESKTEALFETPPRPLHYFVGRFIATGLILWNRRKRILKITAVGFLLSVAYVMLIPKQYTANVCLMPPTSSSSDSALSSLMGLGEGAAAATVQSQIGDMLGFSSPGQLYIRAMQSRSVEDRIIDQFKLLDLYNAKTRFDARNALEGVTQIAEDRQSGVITVSVKDKDPVRAAKIADAYVTELDALLTRTKTAGARREREYYEQQLTVARIELEKASKAFNEFAAHSGAIDITEQGKATVASIANLQDQLVAAEAQLRGTLRVYKEGQGPASAQEAQLDELRRQLAKMGAKGPADNDGLLSIKGLSTVGSQYLELYQRVNVQQSVVAALSQQYELSRLAEARQIPILQIIDSAEVPEWKSYPPRAMLIILLTFLVGCIASVLVVLEDWWRQAPADNPWKSVLAPVIPVRFRRRPLQ